MADQFEDICPRCLEPHMVDGDALVGMFCPTCSTLSFYGAPVGLVTDTIAATVAMREAIDD
jgi:hypothetical protein